ncbi:MAG: DNA polymerase I [Myxococcales bacterium]|nr:DNA polymerase I [Myxococcales bacterium]
MAESTPAATLPPPGDPDTLYVVDISGYVFRAYHALPPMSSSRGEPTHAVRGVTSMMLKLLEERQPKQLCIARDSRASWRKERYPAYKANRPEAPPDLVQQIRRVGEVLAAFRFPQLGATGYEADDVIASVVHWARAAGKKVVIVSADKDLLQLVGDGVVMLDTMRDRVFGPAETLEKFGVPPALVRDLLALTGDSSDNVPGVPSVGPKTAAKLLLEHGDLDGLYAHLDQVKGKVKEKLAEHREAAYLSRELVTLEQGLVRFATDGQGATDVTETPSGPERAIDELDLHVDGGDAHALRALFTELEFTRLLTQLETAPQVEGRVEVVLEREVLERYAAAIRDAGELAIRGVLAGDDALRDDLVGVALAWVEGLSLYVPFAHRYIGAPAQMGKEAALEVLRPLLENSLFPKLAADLKREDLIFAREGVRFRGGRFDVAIASYLYDPGRHAHGLVEVARAELDAELPSLEPLLKPKRGARRAVDELEVEAVAEVVGAEADYVARLAHLLGPRMDQGDFRALYHALELPLSRVLADMERVGVRVDTSLLAQMSRDAEKDLTRLEAKAVEIVGHELNLGSPKQLEAVLFDELGLRVVKRTKTGRSTDASVLEELASEHPLPDVILEHRMISKLKGTYLDALPAAVHPATGRVHTRYNQYVAATGRLSSSDPNLQNIPIRTDLGRRIRDAFVPADGMTLLSADYSQIELRVLAHLSRDPELVDAYTRGEDVHVRTATALFDVKPEEVTREMRGQAKTVNFAVIYGQTQWALAQNLRITKTEAKRYIDAFFERYRGIAAFMEDVVEQARTTGYVTTLLGRRRAVADIRSRNPALRHAAERIAQNTPIQGTAADIIKVAMVRIHEALRRGRFGARMILTVHDELVLEVPHAEQDAVGALVRAEMEGAIALDVPLVAEVGFGASWGAAH